MPELDVLRGVAILVVVLYHGLYHAGAVSSNRIGQIFINLTVFGWLGVNLFFVLSGFLITGILIDSKGKPDFYRNFYLRRALRILPAFFAIIVLLVILHRMSFRTATFSMFFLANYMDTFHLVDAYFPLWSLSVEEQFYSVWPAIAGNVSVRTLAILSAALCVIEPLLRWFVASGHPSLGDIHMSTYLIADNLALGALAAIFARSRFGTLRNGVRAGLATCAAALVILFAGLPFGILHRTNIFGAALQTLPWNLFFTGTLLLLLGLQSPLFSSIWTAPLRFLGYISYGLYLIHMLVNTLYRWSVLHIANASTRSALSGAYTQLILSTALSVLLAWLSRRFYEEPFLRIGRKPKPVQIRSTV
jgi:peptidoglycan/LPS O-acetylase OafA/YrhL